MSFILLLLSCITKAQMWNSSLVRVLHGWNESWWAGCNLVTTCRTGLIQVCTRFQNWPWLRSLLQSSPESQVSTPFCVRPQLLHRELTAAQLSEPASPKIYRNYRPCIFMWTFFSVFYSCLCVSVFKSHQAGLSYYVKHHRLQTRITVNEAWASKLSRQQSTECIQMYLLGVLPYHCLFLFGFIMTNFCQTETTSSYFLWLNKSNNADRFAIMQMISSSLNKRKRKQ